MHRPTALLFLSGTLALAAQQSVTKLWVPIYYDAESASTADDGILASVIAADATATTYGIQPCDMRRWNTEVPCDPSDAYYTIVQGPSMYGFTLTGHDSIETVSEYLSCTAQKDPNTVVCDSTAIAIDSTTRTTDTGRATTSGFVSDRIPVTLTAGLEKLGATPGSGASKSAAPANTGTTTASATASATAKATGSSASSQTQSGTSAKPTASANAAAVKNVGGAVLLGVGALVGSLML